MIRLLTALALTLLLAVPGAASAAAKTFDQAAEALKAGAEQVRAEAAEIDREMEAERAALEKQKAELEAALAVEQAELDRLKVRFDELAEQEMELDQELADQAEEVKQLESVFRVTAKEAEQLLVRSLAGPARPERLKAIEPLRRADRFPSQTDAQALVEVLFDEMAASGQVERRSGRFVDQSGQPAEADLIRAGNFSVVYKQGDQIGFLKLTDKGDRFRAVSGRPGWVIERAVNRYYAGQSQILPLDPSGGSALEQLGHGRTWQERLTDGGPLVYPILALAGIAFLIILERFIRLSLTRANTDRILRRIGELTRAGKLDERRALLAGQRRAPSCRVMLAGLEPQGRTKEAVEAAVEEAILKELPKLERFLPTLSVLAALAPLLGLLGTVTGMINTFQVITRFGASDPRLMAGGISEALITTQLGLAAALPILLCHHFLERRVDHIVSDMEEKGLAVAGGLIAAPEPDPAESVEEAADA